MMLKLWAGRNSSRTSLTPCQQKYQHLRGPSLPQCLSVIPVGSALQVLRFSVPRPPPSLPRSRNVSQLTDE
ncbi:Hypothetical predicted protein [Marmota monax]|uniref:Uncharacterized protein n=1 Tax=Marmota monax TaxID=9995 RepID=A0A5E4AJX9_MARMO|nr:hypothetical protein GHT09_011142 [Marmota monax]VTJ56782.1 Hypothetical predicted protein [Marmota monax]